MSWTGERGYCPASREEPNPGHEAEEVVTVKVPRSDVGVYVHLRVCKHCHALFVVTAASPAASPPPASGREQ